MTKAIFMEKQPEVRTTALDNGLLQFQICLHEEQIEVASQNYPSEEDVKSDPQPQYQYDFNEFRTDALTEDEVKADPAKYLNYTPVDTMPEPEKTVSIEKRIKAISDAQEETAQAVQDMLAMQMEA